MRVVDAAAYDGLGFLLEKSILISMLAVSLIGLGGTMGESFIDLFIIMLFMILVVLSLFVTLFEIVVESENLQFLI